MSLCVGNEEFNLILFNRLHLSLLTGAINNEETEFVDTDLVLQQQNIWSSKSTFLRRLDVLTQITEHKYLICGCDMFNKNMSNVKVSTSFWQMSVSVYSICVIQYKLTFTFTIISLSH